MIGAVGRLIWLQEAVEGEIVIELSCDRSLYQFREVGEIGNGTVVIKSLRIQVSFLYYGAELG